MKKFEVGDVVSADFSRHHIIEWPHGLIGTIVAIPARRPLVEFDPVEANRRGHDSGKYTIDDLRNRWYVDVECLEHAGGPW